MKLTTQFGSLTAIALLVLSITSANAGTISGSGYQGDFFGTDGNMTWNMTPPLGVDAVTGQFALSVPNQDAGAFDVENIVVSGNIDPVISASFDVVNNTGSTQDYTFIFTIPIIDQTPATITGGSMQGGVTDVNGDGATLGVHSTRPETYFSQINGVDFEPLSITPISVGAFLSSSASASFGNPIPSFPGPAAFNNIGIRFDFSLTAGDRATMSGVFVIEAIPEPTSMFLALIGVLPLGIIRRR